MERINIPQSSSQTIAYLNLMCEQDASKYQLAAKDIEDDSLSSLLILLADKRQEWMVKTRLSDVVMAEIPQPAHAGSLQSGNSDQWEKFDKNLVKQQTQGIINSIVDIESNFNKTIKESLQKDHVEQKWSDILNELLSESNSVVEKIRRYKNIPIDDPKL